MNRSERPRRAGLRRLVSLVSMLLLVAAVVRELRLPAGERTWQGRVVGVPYDLRPPTPTRLRQAFWNPEDPRLLTPRPMGVGWAVNVARLVPGRG